MTAYRVVYADRFEVDGRTGRRRLVIIVVCPFCRRRHSHTASPSFTEGRRTAACGGKYQIRTEAPLAMIA